MFKIKDEKIEIDSSSSSRFPCTSASTLLQVKQEACSNEAEVKKENVCIESSIKTEAIKYEQCPICLSYMKNQLLARPIECKHSFCLECIEEWSRVSGCLVFLILKKSNLTWTPFFD